jgi:hypothetical protein
MAVLDPAVATQVANLQQRCGQSLDALFAHLRASGLEKHAALRDVLKRDHGLGHGDANLVVHLFLQAAQPAPVDAAADPLADIYVGPKADLRAIHEAIMVQVQAFGVFDIAPKKGYVSLRRKKQFAMVGPATKSQVEVGLNAKGLTGGARLVEQAPGGMCNYKVRLASVAEVDAELIGWLHAAFEAAG